MFFNKVIGQSQIKVQLRKSVSENRVSHAQLFLGSEGCGNLAMALAFTQYLNCENRSEVDSCGRCPSCLKSQKHIHPDIHFTFPFVKIDKKRDSVIEWLPEWREFILNTPYSSYETWILNTTEDNKQGNIPAKECLEIIRAISLKTFESPYKIVVIWMPEFLGNEGNRLLKTLEEPPDNTVILLVATDQDKIINTVLSRVQIVRFPRLSAAEIAEGLSKNLNIELKHANKIAAQSEGNFNEAVALSAMQENENTAFLREWIECCYGRNIKNLFTWNDKFVKLGREYQKTFFRYCLHFFREILLIEAGVKDLTRFTDAEFERAEGLGNLLGIDKITGIIELFDKAIFFIERNVNAKILITYVSIFLHRQFKRDSVTHKKPFFESWEI